MWVVFKPMFTDLCHVLHCIWLFVGKGTRFWILFQTIARYQVHFDSKHFYQSHLGHSQKSCNSLMYIIHDLKSNKPGRVSVFILLVYVTDIGEWNILSLFVHTHIYIYTHAHTHILQYAYNVGGWHFGVCVLILLVLLNQIKTIYACGPVPCLCRPSAVIVLTMWIIQKGWYWQSDKMTIHGEGDRTADIQLPVIAS